MAEFFDELGLIDVLATGHYSDDQDSDETVGYDQFDPSNFITLDELQQNSDDEEQSVASPNLSHLRNRHTTADIEEDENSRDSILSSNYEEMQLRRRQHSRSNYVEVLDQIDHERDLLDVANASGIAEDSEIIPRVRNRIISMPVIASSSDEESIPAVIVPVQMSNRNNTNNENQIPGSPILPLRSNASTGTLRSTVDQGVFHEMPVQLIVSPPGTHSTQSDFRTSQHQGTSRSKRKHSSPETSHSKKVAVDSTKNLDDSEDDGMCCPICFEPWTNSGSHRLTSLKCGHIFGQKCIERWLKDCHSKCPQCNAKAKKNDLRIIYAKKLTTLDTTDLEQALKEVNKERKSRRECEMELAKVRMQYHMADEECTKLKTKISSLQMQLTACKEKSPLVSSTQTSLSSAPTQSSTSTKSFRCIKCNAITASGGCRVMDFHSRTQQFVVSQPSPHASFMTGFGVRRFSYYDQKGGFATTILHQKPIKDLRFSQHADHHLLSASQDGSLRITDLVSSSKIHDYKLGKPVWSCCWDVKDRNVMYAGLSNGTLMQFDLRKTSEALSSIENSTSKCPIVSLYHIPPSASDNFHGRGGLLTGNLDGASFWQDTGNPNNEGPSLISNFKPTILPLPSGSCTGLHYCPKPQCFLTTFRPGRNHGSTTTHLLCELRCQSTGGDTPRVSCNVIDSYSGGQKHTMLTRNSLLVIPPSSQESTDERVLVCVGDETLSKVNDNVVDVTHFLSGRLLEMLAIYDSNRSKSIQSLDSDGGPALDILPVYHQMDSLPPMLAVLSSSKFKLFSYQ